MLWCWYPTPRASDRQKLESRDGYLSERFRFYRRLAKLPENLPFHSLRHTFASWFVLRGGDLYRLKEILGHADMRTTLKYTHLRPDALREEMRKTFGENSLNDDAEARKSSGVLSEAGALRAEVKRLRNELEEARAVET